MHQITGMAYPQEMLTIVSSPLMKEATHSFGILQLRESWIERPKFVQTHRLLAAQIVHQWTSNIVTFCDECLQQVFFCFLTF
jgi:hypothetical protein